MDGYSHLTRWDNSAFLQPIDQRLPPISAALEGPLQFMSSEPQSSLSASSQAERSREPLHLSPGGQAKRPRLYYDQSSNTTFEQRTTLPPLREDRGFPTASLERASILSQPWDARRPNEVQEGPACSNCHESRELACKVVRGLLQLEREIRRALTINSTSKEDTDTITSELDEAGLKQSLVWASDNIQNSTYLVRNLTLAPPGLRPIVRVAANGRPTPTPLDDQSSIVSVLSEPSNRTTDLCRVEDNSRVSTSTSLYFTAGSTRAFPSAMSADPSRRAHGSDQNQTQFPQSPQQSSSGSVFECGHSPSQMHAASRALPSPASLQFPSNGSSLHGNYSPSISQSAHATHMQDLQHQISTKALALQTLQREHDQLLAAFSRSQIRCSTLDKKSQVSDHEINTLSEEKIQLQSQAESLEAQVEDLIKARDEAHQQTAADRAQWRQIMSMSSKLQAQGAEEAKRFKAEREVWERDREHLQRRIQELEDGNSTLVDPPTAIKKVGCVSGDDILTSTSFEVHRKEIVRLRQGCNDMEVALRDVRRETQQMDHIMTQFAAVRERIASKTRHGLQEKEDGEERPYACEPDKGNALPP